MQASKVAKQAHLVQAEAISREELKMAGENALTAAANLRAATDELESHALVMEPDTAALEALGRNCSEAEEAAEAAEVESERAQTDWAAAKAAYNKAGQTVERLTNGAMEIAERQETLEVLWTASRAKDDAVMMAMWGTQPVAAEAEAGSSSAEAGSSSAEAGNSSQNPLCPDESEDDE